MAELDLTAIAAASIATPSAGVGAVYVDATTKKVASKNDAGLVSDYVDVASAQSVTGVKTLTNPTCLTGTGTVPAMTIPPGGIVLASPVAGAVETDGTSRYYTLDTTNGRAVDDRWQYFRQAGSGQAITTIADVFAASSAIPLLAAAVYEIEWHIWWVHSVTGTGTIVWTITNTQAPVQLVAKYSQSPIGGIGTVGAPQVAGILASTTAAQALPATAANTAIASHYAEIRAVIETHATLAGNVRLRMTAGAGTATISRSSFFRARRLPAGNAGTFAA